MKAAVVILICDDNQADALLLQRMLKKKLAEGEEEHLHTELVFLKSSQLLKYPFQENETYILFMELVFRNGAVDSVKLAEGLREISMDLAMVFTSSHVEFMPYLLKGNVLPAGFLKKPFRYPELCETLDNILNLYKSQKKDEDFFVLNLSNETVRLLYSQILYFEASQKKINLYTISRRFSFYSSLSSIENEIKSNCFVRCHNSFIINTEKTSSISFSDMIVTMENHAILPISRTFKQNVRKVFNDD